MRRGAGRWHGSAGLFCGTILADISPLRASVSVFRSTGTNGIWAVANGSSGRR